MYCPICLSDTLAMGEKGVVNVVINGKQMNNGRFLYNIKKETPEEILEAFRIKAEEFFRWYSSFHNIEAIESVELTSSNVHCINKCQIPAGSGYSVTDLLIPQSSILKCIHDLGDKYNIPLNI